MENKPLVIHVGSRASKLSLKQVQEVLSGIRYHYPQVTFILKCTACRGDLDQKTSLSSMGATDFFTYELDQWLVNKKCRITIHSAKDLPDPLPQGLKVVALTQNQNNEDVLVLNAKPYAFTKYPKVGVSSKRREEGVSKLFPHATFYDLRGTVEKRIEKISSGDLDGIAVAKVALMRLNLMHLDYVHLPIQTPPLQGSLAILAREDDYEMESLFSSIDTRIQNKSLYLGLNPERFLTSGSVTHCPLIKIKPKPLEEISKIFYDFHDFTHLILTSQTTVHLLLECLDYLQKPHSILNQKKVITVGQATAELLMKHQVSVDYIAQKESQEGILELFKHIKIPPGAYLLYPRSSKARPLLQDDLRKQQIRFQAPSLYETHYQEPQEDIDLEDYDEVVFTSPSCVKSFFKFFTLPNKKLNFIFKGPITEECFKKMSLIHK